jgi:hypothetical protein
MLFTINQEKMMIQLTFARCLMFVFVLSMLPLFTLAQSEEALSEFPNPTGVYSIGTTTRYFIDISREEAQTIDPDDKRELMVRFWYPAEIVDGARLAPYIPDSDVLIPAFNSAFLAVSGIDLSLDLATFANLQSHAFLDAPVSSDRPDYPILIFSHGYTAIPEFWTIQLEEMASHGYVVAAINHSYSSAASIFPDGRVLEFNADEPPRLFEIIAEDQIFVADQLALLAEDDPEDMFTGRLNLEQIGIFGQSLGGGAAVVACYRDIRFRACVSEEGTVADSIISNGLDQAFMFMFADDHPDLPDSVYARFNGPTYTLTMEGFRHIDFSDFPLWSDNTLVELSLVGTNDGLRTVEIVNAHLLAFFDKYLKGEDVLLLNGPSEDYPEVDFQLRNTPE